ncbi:MAG: heavy metal translocating P-type ATPase metal-binding domain-containing protein [Chitinophagaceae bacterium]|nr:heavy metal translocating P-type ATPase metal-binding domain-containing protein [Chitinophagaceae bacterium]MCW5904552.1 heavy metal translocating P-type ATPase metal-binding domain-containing protein [Chitinophagaceae bacterium]
MSVSQNTKHTCYHCGNQCNDEVVALNDKHFCCSGCKTVYQILSENDLCAYYDFNEHAGISPNKNIRADKFAFLDNEEIEKKLIQFKDDKQTHVTFYLPQIHCSSCLYLLENIHKIDSNIVVSKINFNKREIFIVFNHQKINLRKVAEILASIGYEPLISLQDTSQIKKKISRAKMYKIGVAGFCFSNIMMLSFPEYLSGKSFVEPELKTLFSYMSFVLSLPVFFYSATEFYTSAWHGLKNKYLNIDIPVVLAILLIFFRSLYHLFFLNENGYFDSMSGLVFFMLIGRIAQDKTQQYLSFERDYTSFFPIAVNKLFDKKFKPTPIEQLKENDVIQIYANEIIPVDAMLSKGNASIDYSFVSGESAPVSANIGDIIYAGGKQTGEKIELMVLKPMNQSYLTNLWNKNNQAGKETKNKFVDKLSKNFTIIVFAIAGIAFLYWVLAGKISVGLDVITTVFIIACPCTLLLAATFTYGNMLRILSQNKVYVRHYNILEKINEIDTIVYDKTGTLTLSNNVAINYVGEELSDAEKIYIKSTASNSKHVYSKSIVQYFADNDTIEIANFKETIGKGIEAWIDEHYIKIGSPNFFNKTNEHHKNIMYVAIDNKLIGYFITSNAYRVGFSSILKSLEKKYTQVILSGDSIAEKEFLEKTLGKNVQMLFNQKPEDKLQFIQQLQKNNHTVLMIGDGLNDAIALKESDVGIAITENNNNFTPACDIILDATFFEKFQKLFLFSKQGKRIIKLSFTFSFIYNVIGMYFALQGLLSPLIAAILMPSSTITIIAVTFGLTQYSAKKEELLITKK